MVDRRVNVQDRNEKSFIEQGHNWNDITWYSVGYCEFLFNGRDQFDKFFWADKMEKLQTGHKRIKTNPAGKSSLIRKTLVNGWSTFSGLLEVGGTSLSSFFSPGGIMIWIVFASFGLDLW